MGKVQLRMPPPLASMLKAEAFDWLVLDREIGEGATIGDLLTELTFTYDTFRQAVFDPESQKVSDQIMVFHNNNLLQGTEVTEAGLNDGDSVILLTVYSGG